MVRVKGAGQELGTKQVEVVVDGENLNFGVKMGYVCHQEAPGDSPQGLVLNDLEGLNAGRAGVGEPDGSRVGENRLNEGLIGKEQGLFLVAPRGASQGLDDVQPLRAPCC